jgi:outer membrane protein OmpA-like peptidoglycan-associated protein/tetratricopeptide (TPR) repeat protein
MKIMKKIILILCLAFFGNLVVAQDKNVPFSKDLFANDKAGFSNAVKEIKLGDLSYYRGSDADLAEALTHFLVADSFNHYSANLNYKIGVCYLAGTQEFKALEYLEFAKKHGEGPEFDGLDFYLGQSYQIAGRYEEAIEKFKAYKETLDEKDTNQKFYINKKVSECRTGIELSKNPKRVWIDNLGPKINSEYPDFGPVISADNRVIFFTSRRPGSTGDESDDSGYEFEDIYYSTREFEGEWNEAENIGEPVNTDSHDATVGLAPDGKSLLTYHGVSRKDGNVLITKQNGDGNWMQTANIGESINTKYHESAATLSFDEKTLFFVSDKPGGYGGHDIYMANWDEEKGAWGEAENVGATLNTEYEEKGVFFHPDNKTLYFSSEGHKTIGGLDIFKSEYNSETGEWSTPENLGVPINTSSDDVYFVVSGNEKYAYYSSVKPDGYGEKDIYKITFLGDKKDPLLASVNVSNNELMTNKNGLLGEFESNKLVLLTGVVTDGNSKEPLVSDLSIVNSKTNEKITNILLDDDGSYMAVVPAGVTYAISSTKTGYTIASKTIAVDKKAEGSEIKTDLELYPPVAGGEFVLRNIYFSFDKDDLRHVSIEELDKLVTIMKENPSLVIELGGHTDRRGPESYNQSLSERRAKIAKDYLVKHGISKDRIQTKGYGESKPEVSGETINNMETKREKEQAHQQNRRTVVTIISK